MEQIHDAQVKPEVIKLFGALTLSLLSKINNLPIESVNADLMRELRENVSFLVTAL